MRIHFIAIGGAIMHSLAIELKNNGHIISGSDDVIYDPAKSNLEKHNLLPKSVGWNASRIHKEIDVVILGMHAKLDNPELLKAQDLQLKIVSFPEFIYDYSKSKKRIVIAGSHGKTTITSMILHVLNDNNIKVDYLLGAKIESVENLVNLKDNEVIIIEGDEYLSSAIDKRPKFLHYQPTILVVSGVAWDHVNVFPTLASYQKAFKDVLNNVIDSSGQVFFNGDDLFLSSFLENTTTTAYSVPHYQIENGVLFIEYNSKKIPLKIFGKHNLYNLEAAKSVCLQLGLSEQSFYSSIQKFIGANKRLNLVKEYESNSSIYLDFAHSPSKVLATIDAVKELYPNRYLIACLELYTYSSLNPDFIPQYHNVFDKADEVWIYIDQVRIQSKNKDVLEEEVIYHNIQHKKLRFINKKELLFSNLSKLKFHDMNLLLMSSGTFSGLIINNVFN